MPTPNRLPSDSTGLSDSQWISDVREALQDFPVPANGSWTADGVGGVFGVASAPLTLDRGPVYDGWVGTNNAISTYVAVRDNTAATNYTVITSGTPTSSQVLLDPNARTLTFLTAPTSGHAMQAGWYTCKFSNTSILTALYAGLSVMFPSVGKTYVDTSVQIQPNQWDYALPSWAAAPDAVVSMVEVQDPYVGNTGITVQPWVDVGGYGWYRSNGLLSIHIPRAQRWSPAARLRITGWGGYQALGDLEPDLYHLPIWYALSVLLPKRESFRIRQDTLVPMAGEGGQQPGLQVQTGDYYAKRFDAELKQKSRAYGPPAISRPIVSTYAFRDHS